MAEMLRRPEFRPGRKIDGHQAANISNREVWSTDKLIVGQARIEPRKEMLKPKAPSSRSQPWIMYGRCPRWKLGGRRMRLAGPRFRSTSSADQPRRSAPTFGCVPIIAVSKCNKARLQDHLVATPAAFGSLPHHLPRDRFQFRSM